jgi:uncharacterized protein YjbI with pentapeptide repeats
MPLTLEALTAGASFEDETVDALDLRGFDFAGKELTRVAFTNVDLRETRWRGARLEDCAFDECDLTDARTDEIRAYGVRFHACKLLGVAWTEGSLDPGLAFEASNLRYASFVKMNLRGARFVGCDAKEASFLEVDLTDADFSEADLTGAVFERATLLRADFTTARGASLDPAKNRVKGARVGLETAALVAASFGMKVVGVAAPTRTGVAEPRRGPRKSR